MVRYSRINNQILGVVYVKQVVDLPVWARVTVEEENGIIWAAWNYWNIWYLSNSSPDIVTLPIWRWTIPKWCPCAAPIGWVGLPSIFNKQTSCDLFLWSSDKSRHFHQLDQKHLCHQTYHLCDRCCDHLFRILHHYHLWLQNYQNWHCCAAKVDCSWDSPIVWFWGASILWSKQYVLDNEFTAELPITYGQADVKSDGKAPKNIRHPIALNKIASSSSLRYQNNTLNFSIAVLNTT